MQAEPLDVAALICLGALIFALMLLWLFHRVGK